MNEQEFKQIEAERVTSGGCLATLKNGRLVTLRHIT